MSGKTKLFLLFSACLLTMCTNSPAEPVTYANGLSCVSVSEEEVNCSYTCSDGTVREVNVSGTDFSLDSSSKDELDAELCSIVVPTATAMASLLTAFPVSSASSKPVATITSRVSPTPGSTLSAQVSPTAGGVVTLPAPVALLSGTVSMCDLGGKLINFRMTQPVQDIAGRNLKVQLDERESTCYLNPTNRSLLTCTIPIGVSFPANIVVRLEERVVNEFVYSGFGCAVITTPTPAPRPTHEPEPTTYP